MTSDDRLLVYFSCLLAGREPENLARARRWLWWLTKRHPEYVFECSWMGWTGLYRGYDPATGLVDLPDRLLVVRRCDAIVLCGGRMSARTTQELSTARRLGLYEINYLHLGEEPPDEGVSVMPKDLP